MMTADEKNALVTEVTNQLMGVLTVSMRDADLDQDDKELAMVSLATSVCASVIATIGAWNGHDTATMNATFGTLVRGIGEALAAYDEPVGQAQWTREEVLRDQ